MVRKRITKVIACITLVCMLVISGCANNSQVKDDTSTKAYKESESTTDVVQNESVSKDNPTEGTTEATKAPATEAATPGATQTPTKPATGEIKTLTVEGKYTVYDPDNVRGLSTKGSGWGYGYAKGGKPHQISINNQARFDNLKSKGIQALALDTKSEGKVLYLTFDCGYEYNNNTPKILDVLKTKNVKAAFFCTKPFVTGYGNVVQRMINEGHVVGNHSTTHPVFTKITRTQMAEELWGVSSILKSKYNYDCKYFRFPTGENSESSLELVTSQGYKSVFWSIAHVDWDTANQPTEEKALATVTERLHPGAVILLHTVSNTNVAILDDFIDAAQAQGYTFVTLDDYKWN